MPRQGPERSLRGPVAKRRSGPISAWLVFPASKLLFGKARGAENAKIDDIFIYNETYGSGPPVILLHGGLGSIVS